MGTIGDKMRSNFSNKTFIISLSNYQQINWNKTYSYKRFVNKQARILEVFKEKTMKKYVLSILTIALATIAFAPVASASGQTSLRGLAAEKGRPVTVGELIQHNRDYRD